jgi:Mrp family chromosome partitioning ATPase
MQTLPLDGFVMVTTPQILATIDAKRSINMVRKLNLKILGIVENYVGDIFGEGAGKSLAEELDVPFLGSFELRSDYRKSANKPTVLTSETVRDEYEKIAQNLDASLQQL